MIRLGKAVTLVSLLCATIFLGLIVALHHSRNHARRTTEVLTSLGVKKITFSNPVASGAFARVHASFVSFFSLRSEFYVDGTSIPEVNFDVGPSWSGLIPISGAANETRKVRDSKLGNDTDKLGLNFVLLIFQLFFWFFPPGPEGSLDDLIFWYDVFTTMRVCIDCILNDCLEGLTVVLVARRWKVSYKRME